MKIRESQFFQLSVSNTSMSQKLYKEGHHKKRDLASLMCKIESNVKLSITESIANMNYKGIF